MLVRYDSPAKLADAFDALRRTHPQHYDRANRMSGWTGGNASEASAKLRTGDDSLVAEARKLLDKFEVQAETTRPEWQGSVFGAYPMVPEALAGNPESMRRIVNVGSDLAPICIYASTTSSAGYDHADMTKRGIAVLALTMALSALRPVELFTITQLDGRGKSTRDDGLDSGACIIVTRINSQPLDLSTACHCLTSVAVDRGITHALGFAHHGFTGGWSWGGPPNGDKVIARTRRVLDMNERDVLITGAFLTDDIIKNPVAWVQREIADFLRRNAMDEDAVYA